MVSKIEPSEFIGNYLRNFPSGTTSWITNPPWISTTINNIYQINKLDFAGTGFPSKVINTFLSNVINTGYDYLSKLRLIKSNQDAISLYEGEKRNSGKPEAIHSISVEFILSKLNLPVYVVIAGLNHDKVEWQISKHKKENPEIKENPKLLEALTNNLFKKQFLDLKKIYETTINNDESFDLKEILYSSIILQKVTRIERDNNYYQSIERIFNLDIDSEKSILENNLSGVFEEYKRIKGETPIFNDNERRNILEQAIIVKLADRISNTLDTYPEQTFTKRIKDIYKSLYMINRVSEYMNTVSISDKRKDTYKAITSLRSILIEANDKILKESMEYFILKKDIQDLTVIKKRINHDLREYKNQKTGNGFNSLDYGFDENLFSGTFRGIWNRVIMNDEQIINKLNNSPFEQLLALTCLNEVNNNLRHGISLKGFDMLVSERKLNYFDDMGEKYSNNWKIKKEEREQKGISTIESYYKNEGN